jgi:peroxiredoxin Q/BCP
LRDKAEEFAAVDAIVLGASFDTPVENKAFAEAQSFGFRLLSDVDRAVGSLYETARAPDHDYAALPRRISYLIDPDGVISKAYAVKDVATHAGEVLADIEERRSS